MTAAEADCQDRKTDRLLPITIGIIVLAALALRLTAARTEFWLDEVWSWHSAMSIDSVLKVFTAIHDDNNHYLNTLWMWLLGDQDNWQIYRWLSIVTGTASVALLAIIARRRGKFQSVAAGLMGACCYMMVLFSSEARGFAPAAFFGLLCIDQLQRYFKNPSLKYVIVYSISSALGLLSHLTFYFIWGGLVWYGGMEVYARSKKWRDVLIHLISFNSAAAAAGAVVYFLDLRQVIVGGGPNMNFLLALCGASSCVYGAPIDRFWPGLLACATCLLVVGETLTEQWEKQTIRGLYFSTLVFMPLACTLITDRAFIYPRHFAVCVPILILVLADILARMRKTGKGKLAAAALVGLFCLANIMKFAGFMTYGRGQYLEAVNYISSHSSTQAVASSTQDFQTALMVGFYNRYLPGRKRIMYIAEADMSRRPPEWIIVPMWNVRTSQGAYMGPAGDIQPVPALHLPFADYKLDRQFVHSSELSGSHWMLYHRQS